MAKLTVDASKCIGCGACASVCPAQEYTLKNGKSTVTGDESECLECHACENACPVQAIKVR
ncbi:MAG: 4Fe-4S binding protein [Candidatus Diapherotrites archaeon]|nr:4Fe-4S binding protein [Candidatus Diapherotrites archaeon]